MAETMTMKLKVDLKCRRCYEKVKKLICKIPEIKEAAYHEGEDTVTIKVVCCCPERIRQKLICKGGKSIKSIEILKKPNLPPDPKPKPPVTGYPPMYPFWGCCRQCLEGRGGGGSCHHGYGIPYQPPYYYGYVRLAPTSYDSWPSGCHCDRSYGCRCEYSTENYPPCAIM